MIRRFSWVVLGVSICFLASCGSSIPTTELQGTVTYNGAPFNEEGIHITFTPNEGPPATAEVAPTGTYKATNVVIGPNKVSIYYLDPAGKKKLEPGVKGQKTNSKLWKLSPKFADPTTSLLSTEVVKGKNYDVDLKGPVLK